MIWYLQRVFIAIPYFYYKLVFYNISKNRYSYKFITGYIVKIVRQIHFVHSTECHSLIQKNDLILLDKNFFVHYILQYNPSSGVHFGIDVYLNRWDLLILLCIQRRMLTKKIGQSTFSCFLSSSIFLYVCMKDVVLNDKGYVSYIPIIYHVFYLFFTLRL